MSDEDLIKAIVDQAELEHQRRVDHARGNPELERSLPPFDGNTLKIRLSSVMVSSQELADLARRMGI